MTAPGVCASSYPASARSAGPRSSGSPSNPRNSTGSSASFTPASASIAERRAAPGAAVSASVLRRPASAFWLPKVSDNDCASVRTSAFALAVNVASTASQPGERAKLKFRNDIRLSEVWGRFLVWLLVSACTLGLGWIIVSGHFFKLVINFTRIEDAEGRAVVIWLLVCIATLGVGLLFYSFHAARAALEATEIEWTTRIE